MLKPTDDNKAKLTAPELIEAVCGDCQMENQWDDNDCRSCRQHMESAISAQITKLEKLGYHRGLPDSISEALNSGDGVYRP